MIMHGPKIDGEIKWTSDCLIDWLIGWLIDWLSFVRIKATTVAWLIDFMH